MHSSTSTRRRAEEGWRTQPYMLGEGTYEFAVEAVEGRDPDGFVLRLRVVAGPLAGHRILVKEAAPVLGLSEAIADGRPCTVRATIMRVQGRGLRFVDAALV